MPQVKAISNFSHNNTDRTQGEVFEVSDGEVEFLVRVEAVVVVDGSEEEAPASTDAPSEPDASSAPSEPDAPQGAANDEPPLAPLNTEASTPAAPEAPQEDTVASDQGSSASPDSAPVAPAPGAVPTAQDIDETLASVESDQVPNALEDASSAPANN